jgi:2,3-dimethylmalate lyase
VRRSTGAGDPAGARLSALLEQGFVVAGGAYDALSATLLEGVGYEAIYLSGAGVTISRLGMPDLGLITLTEMLDVARRVVQRAGVPVIADVDTGFGGAINVARTVEEFAAAGVAAIQLEDQEFPKRCGHLDGKSVIPREDFVTKVKVADRVRAGTGMLVIGRTDAIAVEGLDAAIDRANAALDAGADIAFVEAPRSMAEVEAVAARVGGRKLFNLVAGGNSPDIAFSELERLGFALAILPPLGLVAAYEAIGRLGAEVLASGSDEPLRALDVPPRKLFETYGLDEWLAVGQNE